MIDHSAYTPDPMTHVTWTAGRTYCPACQRLVRCGRFGRFGDAPTYYRHWLDPSVPRGERDRCVNSRQPVAEARFCSDSGLIVSRAEWEASQ